MVPCAMTKEDRELLDSSETTDGLDEVSVRSPDGLLKLYNDLPPMDPRIMNWTLQLNNSSTKSPIIMPGETLCNIAVTSAGYLCAAIILLATSTSAYYVYLHEHEIEVAFDPEYCGPVVSLIYQILPNLTQAWHHLSIQDRIDKRFHLHIIDFLTFLSYSTYVITSAVWVELIRFVPNQWVPLGISSLAFLTDALSVSGALAAYLLWNLIAMIDINLNYSLLAFLVFGTIASRMKNYFYCKSNIGHTKETIVERNLFCRSRLGKTKKPRTAVQIFANGYPLLCLFFPLYLSCILFPPHLGDSVAPYVNILRPNRYRFLGGKGFLQLGFFLTAIGKYLQGARDLILSITQEKTLNEMPVSFIKLIISRQVFMGICAVCGDTFASDLGQSWINQPVFSPVAPFRRVKRGTQGGISIPGIIWSGLGGLTCGIALLAAQSFTGILSSVFISKDILMLSIASGVVGSYIDSILGWYLQPSACDVFGIVLNDRLASLVKGLEYLDLLKTEMDPKVKILINAIKEFEGEMPMVPSAPYTNKNHMIPLNEAVGYRLIDHAQLLKPSTIVLDNHSVNFITPVLTTFVMNLFALKR